MKILADYLKESKSLQRYIISLQTSCNIYQEKTDSKCNIKKEECKCNIKKEFVKRNKS